MAAIRLWKDEVTDLPPVCMRCGEPAESMVSKRFAWAPPWTLALLLAGLLPWLIVTLLLRKTMHVRAPLCHEHRWHWAWRTGVIFGTLGLVVLIGIGAIVLNIVLEEQRHRAREELSTWMCCGSVMLFVLWLFPAAIIQATSIKAGEITDQTITLSGVSPEFREVVYAEREAQPPAPPAVVVPAGMPVAAAPQATKLCPYCSEEIKALAVKCRFCGEFLDA